jgi:hypothetical protein
MRDKMYDAYLEFFQVAEGKRRWNIFDDVPWDKLDPSLNSERKATRIETYCAEEFYLPDYTAGARSSGRRGSRPAGATRNRSTDWSFANT